MLTFLIAKRFHTFQPPHGIFAVTGNHEYFAGLENSLRFLRNAGVTVLRGEAASVGGLILVGVDDSTAGVPLGQEVKLDTKKALAAANNNDYIVLLKHQPVERVSNVHPLHQRQVSPSLSVLR